MSSLACKFEQLKLYLKALPEALPLVDITNQDAKINRLLMFSIDEEWVQDVGEEGAVNREIEVALQQFLPRNDAGIFYITQQGKGIEELATVLEYWVTKLPGSTILQSWLKSSIDSAEKCILKYGGKVSFPSVDDAPGPSRTALQPKNVPWTSKLTMHLDHQGQHRCLRMCCQTTLNGSAVATFHKSIRKDPKKPDTKALHDTEDSDYITDDESDDGRKGGKKIFPLLLRISRPCHAITDPQKKMARCIASKGCRTTWGWPRDKTRILKHAMHCGYLAKMEGGALVRAAVEELAGKQPSLLDQLDKKMGIEKKRTHKDLSGASMEAPPLKRSRTEPLVGCLSKFPESSGQTKLTPICAGSSNLSFSKYRTEGRKALKEKANKALIEFIMCCGIPPRIIQHQKFKNLVNVLNGNYIPPSCTTFEDSLVPSYAAATQLTVINYLKKCRDMTLTFDGGKLGMKKFFSVHVTTAHRQSFCMELDDVDRLSQTGEYICDLLYKVLSQLQDLLAFMGLSTYTLDWFDVARKDLHIQHGLQSVGETRFGTIYWSLDSVVQGIPAFTKIVRNPGLGIDNARDLKQLGAVLMPFARAIQCLEAKDTNPADVYTYWLVIVAHLQDLLTKDDSLKEKSKYGRRFLIENERASNVYLTAFVLDPENQAALILTNPNPLSIPSVTMTREKGKPTIRSRPEIIDGIGLSLLKLLQNEYGDEYRAGRSVEEARRNPHEALHALKAQFRAYLAGVELFNRKCG
ncbi:hypothetical protein F5148DRAFT_1278703 [Russula earlei]|uniref:Uncharacterized protein n=1 Tax=Russula earlei TaxID=71964 RepID=A0ACC0TSZ0_9AGAM|nr:hypothetical protein F5148DRAFT_1278703 [Russula earlei]